MHGTSQCIASEKGQLVKVALVFLHYC